MITEEKHRCDNLDKNYQLTFTYEEDSDDVLNNSVTNKSVTVENSVLKDLNKDLHNQVIALQEKVNMFHYSIPAPTLNNATVNDDSTSLSELLLQMKTEINDNFEIPFTEMKNIRLKLTGLECKISSQHTG